jgi:hypothetical protein
MLYRSSAYVLGLAISSVLAFGVHASCTSQSAEKKLAGAARTSFLTKCEHDAAASCSKAAQDKKLSGAARTSFEKKCTNDAMGSAPRK